METQTCNRCGYTFTEKKRTLPTRDVTRPSLPPASPHRAGHYSGLHPEDQPYQSSMVAIQRPPVPVRKSEEGWFLSASVQQEAEQGSVPIIEDVVPIVISAHHEKPQTEGGILRIGPSAVPYTRRDKLSLNTDGVLPALYRPQQPGKSSVARRIIPILLTLSCIFFLVASGILVYIVARGKFASTPFALNLTANPAIVRPGDVFMLDGKGFAPSTQVKFTHDLDVPIDDSMKQQLQAITDHRGLFSVDVIVPTDWSVGQHAIHATDETQQSSTSATITVQQPSAAPPQLQLLTTSIDLGTDRVGTTSRKQVMLKNAGGGELVWQQSSDVAWLTASPISNSYTFSDSSSVTITANRSGLTPQAYTGHITFTQKSSRNVVKLTVTMKVDTAPAALNVSASLLTFSATGTQSVPTQSVTLQNSGGKMLNWRASTATNDGANWLYLTGSANGQINSKQSQQLVVGVQAQQLAVGTYQGTITLTGGASATINVLLTVVAPGNILVSPTALSFAALTGQSTAGKTLTIQNSGGQSQNWSVSTTTADSGNWLSVTAQSGTVGANGQMMVTVNIDNATLKAGAYQGTLTFTGGNQIEQVPVSLTITTPPAAAISIQSTSLTFQTVQKTDPIGQWLTITNTGNAPLNWSATDSGNGAAFLSLSQSSGSISPQTHTMIEVSPKTSMYNAGTLTTTITFADSDVGTTVGSQKIPVTIVVQSQAAIAVSPSNFNLNTSGPNTNMQTVTITNTGSALLNWMVSIHTDAPIGVSWLSVNTVSGTLAPGASKTILVNCSSAGLQKGTSYSGSIQISDSDSGTAVLPQMLYVTFYS